MKYHPSANLLKKIFIREMSTARKLSLKHHALAWWHHSTLNFAFAFYNLQKLRFWKAVKSFFFIIPPPQLHHSRKDISDLSNKTTKEWFKFGLNGD